MLANFLLQCYGVDDGGVRHKRKKKGGPSAQEKMAEKKDGGVKIKPEEIDGGVVHESKAYDWSDQRLDGAIWWALSMSW